MRLAIGLAIAVVLSSALRFPGASPLPAYGNAPESASADVVRQGAITGRVTDAATEQPVAGANVTVVGTELGAMTAADGAYQIVGVPAGTYRVRISVIGYGADERSVSVAEGETITLDFALEQEALLLDELVVIGYGTERARTVTGAVARIGMEGVQDVPVANATTLLQGQLPGVVVSSFSAQPGDDDAQIRIRGIGTLNAGQNPLVIIDGVTASISQFGQIPAADVANVTVLKDAASAAIYGARAANGVILVETRQGARGSTPRLTFRSTVTQQRPLIDLDLLDSWDYARIVNEWQIAEGSQPLYTDEMIQAMRDGSAPDQFANTNWYREVVRPSPMQEHYVAVTGGSSSTRYRLSAQYRDQEGIMRGTDARQFSLRSNLDVDVGSRARVGFDLSGYWQGIDQPSVVNASGGESSVLYQVRRFAKPTIPVRYANGEWGVVDGLYPDWGFPISNPVQAVGLGEHRENQHRIRANLSGVLDVLPNLVVQSRVSGTYYASRLSQFEPTTRSFDAAGDLLSNNPTNKLTNNNDTEYELLNANTVTYRPRYGRHNFTLLGGQSVEYYRRDFTHAYAEGFPNDNIRQLTAGVENLSVDGWAYDNALFSLFGRLSYDYDERYLFDANLRYDGSSRFAKGNRFALFPSFAAGWILSDESFMHGVPLLDFLKLRASWGRLGNQAIGNQEIGHYPYSQTYGVGENYIIGNDLVGGAAITSLANPDVMWETTTITDIGVDPHLFG
jgi:TonB-dependent starch-binding outer membrane protein SusC